MMILGNGSALYELTVPVHLADDGYYRSEYQQVYGGWNIKVAITPGLELPESAWGSPWSTTPILPGVEIPGSPVLPVEPTPVPEPHGVAIVALALLALVVLISKRNAR